MSRKLDEANFMFYCGFCGLYMSKICKVRVIGGDVPDIIRPSCKCTGCGNMMKRED